MENLVRLFVFCVVVGVPVVGLAWAIEKKSKVILFAFSLSGSYFFWDVVEFLSMPALGEFSPVVVWIFRILSILILGVTVPKYFINRGLLNRSPEEVAEISRRRQVPTVARHYR